MKNTFFEVDFLLQELGIVPASSVRSHELDRIVGLVNRNGDGNE